MEEKSIRRNLYRVLRKTGVKKQDIRPNASFSEDLNFDPVDWTIFTYYLEGIFNISINDDEFSQLSSIKNTINYLGRRA